MAEAINICTCTRDGYSPDCPNVFMQGSTLCHTLDRETKLRPREYVHPVAEMVLMQAERTTDVRDRPSLGGGNSPTASSDGSWENATSREREMKQGSGALRLPTPTVSAQSEVASAKGRGTAVDYEYEKIFNEIEQYSPSPLHPKLDKFSQVPQRQRGNEIDFTEANRAALKKFEALSFNGQSVSDATIGGFTVDLRQVAEKVRDLIPLPPSKLPSIFNDGALNFYHHFFQGMEIMLSRKVILEIISAANHSDKTALQLMPMIKHMLSSGHQKSDNEITVFTKKVLMSTFEYTDDVRSEVGSDVMTVATNIWGFQYIEAGMQCKESDLRMWLSMCYNHFQTLWFNTFKSSGVPAFATNGVQTRYESEGRKYSELAMDDYLRDDRYDRQEDRQKKHRTRTRKSDWYREQEELRRAQSGTLLTGLFGRR
jgi:hypothetical protein